MESDLKLPDAEESVGGSFRFLWRFMSRERKRHFYLCALLMLLGAVGELMTIGAVLPFLTVVSDPERAASLPFFGSLLAWGGDGEQNVVLAAALLLIASAAIAALLRLLLNWVSLNFVLMLGHEMGTEIFARMLRQPYTSFVRRNTSELLASVEKVQAAIWGVLMPGMQAGISAVLAVAIVALLFSIDPLTAATASATMLLAYIALSFAARRTLARNSSQLAHTATERMQIIQEGLGGIRDVILEQSQSFFEAKHKRADYAYRHAQVTNNFIGAAPRFVIEAVGIMLIAVLAVHLSAKPGGVVAAIPVLGALALGAQRLLPLMQTTYLGWTSFVGNQRMLLDAAGLMQAPVLATVQRDRKQEIVPFRRDLVLDRVEFRYDDREYALREISLSIPKGSRIGFVGETGSGKSTLLDLIMGLLEPTAGEIRIDGESLSNANRAKWQAQIAHVPQMIYLSDSSIASNIAFAEPEEEIDPGRVRRAAEMAQIHDFIEQLPEGYETPVGERGVRLSGGQRQRIGIARALYKRSAILILDEATSALDDATETALMAALRGLGDDMTLLMIAHRTSTLRGCDRVVRLSAGRVVEEGSFQEVIAGRSEGAGSFFQSGQPE